MVKNSQDGIDHALDAALEMTFPASDPIALFIQEYDGWNDASERHQADNVRQRRSAE